MKVKTIPYSASSLNTAKSNKTAPKKLLAPKLPKFDQLQSRPRTSSPLKVSKRQRLKMNVEKSLRSGVPLTRLRTKQSSRNFLEQRRMQSNERQKYSTRPLQRKILDRTALNFHFFTPENENKGQFNEIDKVLYSFKKRMFLGYINSLMKNYDELSLKKPLLKSAIENEKHTLTGKILFDKEGNIIKINILKSSLNDDVHALFENTLVGINSLPNPPQMILQNKDDFTVYYQLSINER